MKFFFFDTETTWKDPKNDRIIQLWYIFWNYDFETKKFNEIRRTLQNIYVDEDIPSDVSKIHWIYKEDLVWCWYFKDYVDDFLHYFKSADYIVGHNIEFDRGMFLGECGRLKIKLPDDFKYIDTMKPTTEFVNWKWGKWPKLMALHEFLFWYWFENAHDAMSDITATKNCFLELLEKYDIYDYIKPNNPKFDVSYTIEQSLEKRKWNDEAMRFIKLVREWNRSIFLTWNAWTWKSTLIKDILGSYNNSKYPPIVLWSTWLSAINIWWQTLHSFFAMWKENVYFKDIKFFLKDKWNKLFRMKKSNIELLKNAPFVVIDEVSMVSSLTIDCMDYLMKYYLWKDEAYRRYLPFGWKQVILVWDVYQLPPVADENRNKNFWKYYSSEWFFDSESFDNWDFRIIQLKTIYRQKDSKLVTILNDIRNNNIKDSDVESLNDCVYNDLPSDTILLTTHKNKASKVNNTILQNLSGNEIRFHGSVSWKYYEKMMIVDKDLVFKIWAKVMLMTNIDFIDKNRHIKKLANWSIGVIEWYESNNWVERLKVNFDWDLVSISNHIWENNEYTIVDDKVETQTVWEYEQIPLQLAYAITIHKSQWLTFKQCKIDLADAFAGWQWYTALSRVESLWWLKLLWNIDKSNLFYDDRILYFKEKFLEWRKYLVVESGDSNVWKNEKKEVNLEDFRDLRTRLSKKLWVPWLAIFSNQILEKFVIYKPKSLDEMFKIPWIKPDKVEKYWMYFIDLLND